MTTLQAPSHTTTVDQHVGTHSTGMRMMRLTNVQTRFSDYSQESWDGLTEDQQQWWIDTLADLHEAEVELAELDYAPALAARTEIEQAHKYQIDLGDCAAIIRSAIEAATASA